MNFGHGRVTRTDGGSDLAMGSMPNVMGQQTVGPADRPPPISQGYAAPHVRQLLRLLAARCDELERRLAAIDR